MSRISRRGFLVGAAAVPVATAVAAPAFAATDPLSAAVIREDVRLLRRAYETLHPGLLRYNTAADLAARFDRLAAGEGAESLDALYLRLSRFLTTIRCGHSYANFFNQSGAVQAALFDRDDRLPFQFLWRDGRMIVTADPTGLGLAPGTEIVAIDDRPAGAILTDLLAVARADGSNDGKRRQLMSVQGQDGYESFDVFHGLMAGRPRYRLTVEGADGRRRELTVEAISLAARRAQRPPAIDDADDTPQWTLTRRGDAAVLTMPGWGLYNSAWDWRGWLDARMDQVIADGAPRLIVDIRDNEGGLDCGDVLIARLIDRPVVPDTARRLVRYLRIPEDLRPVLDTWDRSFDDWGEDSQPYDERFWTLARSAEEGGVIAPKGPRFTGAVDVLIGPQNSSATFGFAQTIKRERLGRLVGETTGGNRRGINGGAFYFLRLPGTGLEVDLPLIGSFPLEPQPDAGITPDLEIPRTRDAIAEGRDEVLETVLSA